MSIGNWHACLDPDVCVCAGIQGIPGDPMGSAGMPGGGEALWDGMKGKEVPSQTQRAEAAASHCPVFCLGPPGILTLVGGKEDQPSLPACLLTIGSVVRGVMGSLQGSGQIGTRNSLD